MNRNQESARCRGEQTTSPQHVNAGILLLLLTLLAPLPLSGCKSSQTQDQTTGGYTTASLFSDQYKSVAVPIFDNKTLYTGVERHLTDALIKEIQSRTSYVVHAPGNADTILKGTIVAVEKTKLSQLSGSGLVEDAIISITIDFEWEAVRSGAVIVQRKRFQAGDVYIPAQPISERPQIGLWAVAEELAQDIVSTMQEAW